MQTNLPPKNLHCLATYDGCGRIIAVSNPGLYAKLWQDPSIGKIRAQGIQTKLQKYTTVKKILLDAQINIDACIEGYKPEPGNFLYVRKANIDSMVQALKQ